MKALNIAISDLENITPTEPGKYLVSYKNADYKVAHLVTVIRYNPSKFGRKCISYQEPKEPWLGVAEYGGHDVRQLDAKWIKFNFNDV